ncbi:hypothetical protein [uncultured Curtobacterium sp.]|uniref:hypothetical protein n=1 Tax=uncultured Curtobacterium sp. TaxID=331964 RepID=UPI00258D86B6|nr:hypothetical protein [uncultured Curtobacterium sp.]
MKMSRALCATTGLALTLGAAVLGAVPAGAATITPTAVSSATSADAGAHTFGAVEVTSSIARDGVVTVSGTVHDASYANKTVQIAAGVGWQGSATVGADGSFTVSTPSAQAEYVLRFGKQLTPTLFVATGPQIQWYAVQAPADTVTTASARSSVAEPSRPTVFTVDGQYADQTEDEQGDPEDIWVFSGHATRTADVFSRAAGTLRVSAFDGSETREVSSQEVAAGSRTALQLTLPDGASFAEYTLVVEDGGQQSAAYRFILQEV